MQARPARPCARRAAPGVLGAAVAGGLMCVWVSWCALCISVLIWCCGLQESGRESRVCRYDSLDSRSLSLIERLEDGDEILAFSELHDPKNNNTSGDIYAARTPVLPDLYKLGYTKISAEHRVKGLSTCTGVAEPFTLEYKAYVPDVRLYEKAMHAYFSDARIYGRKKEFFAVEPQHLESFFAQLNGRIKWCEKDLAKWNFSLKTAKAGSSKKDETYKDSQAHVHVVEASMSDKGKKRAAMQSPTPVRSQQSSLDREADDLHVQERVMAENPRDFNQKPASDDDDDASDDGVGSARTSKKHSGGFVNNNKGKHPTPTSLLKGNYSALERSASAISSTTQAEIDELTIADVEKDAAIAALTASNAEKDAVIERLTTSIESLTNASGSKMDQLHTTANDAKLQINRLMHLLQTTTDDAKLQRAQHTYDLETKIDQVRTAVISCAEGTGRQITTALDSHGEMMVAEMDRMMQEKGACEQHVMEKYQRASAKAHHFNKAKKAYVAEIQKLKTDLMVETRLRQYVIDNFFELIPIPSDRQTAKQHRLPHKESPPTPPTPP